MIPAHAAGTIPVRLERSMLFVPASRWPVIEKAAASAADVVCIDLEDSVAMNEKASSRANVIRALKELDFGRRVRMFRINDLETPFAYRDLIEIVEAAGQQIDLVMLPKANSPADIAFTDKLLTQIEAHCVLSRRIGMEAQIETAAGFLAIREIARSSPRLEALIFGPGDYAASMQMPSGSVGEFDRHDEMYPGHRWHAVMHSIVAAARANGLRCVDGPYAAYEDSTGLERACNIASAMGFDGKQCIHPNQLAVANAIFTPAAQDAAHAEQVVEAYERAVAEKRGVVSLNGKMIDAASVRMAKTILQKQRLIKGHRHE
ncbi:MAG: HpcH/HpaI aldolase/citrate lyase family protein [Candidatus Acidiferrales bacterium]